MQPAELNSSAGKFLLHHHPASENNLYCLIKNLLRRFFFFLMDQAARSNMPLLMQKGLLKTKFLPRQMHIENGKSVSEANRF